MLSQPSGSRGRERGIKKDLWSVFGLLPEGNKEIIIEKKSVKNKKLSHRSDTGSQKTVEMQTPQEFVVVLERTLYFQQS